jgi:hypothetical protein
MKNGTEYPMSKGSAKSGQDARVPAGDRINAELQTGELLFEISFIFPSDGIPVIAGRG